METIDRDDPRPEERSFLSLLPWRNFRRALFLILALLGVVAIKKSGGGAFRNLLDSVAPVAAVRSTAHSAGSAPPATTGAAPATTVHLQVPPVPPR